MEHQKIKNYIKDGDIDKLKQLIDSGLDVNSKYENCDNLVSEAAYAGQSDLVRLLIENGAEIESRNCNGGTPLQWAVAHEDLELIEFLCEKGADANTSKQGIKVLTQAVYKGFTPAVKTLLEYGANPTTSDARYTDPSLLCASKHGYGEIVELLLKYKVKKYVSGNENALAAACRHDQIEVVKILLNKGKFKLNQKKYKLDGHYYHSPLEESCINGNLDCARLLLQAGADPDFAFADPRRAPIYYAAREGHIKIVKLLHKHGATLEYKDRDEETYKKLLNKKNPLGIACENGHSEVVKYLVDNGANPTTGIAFDGDYTPIDLVPTQGQMEILEYLKKKIAEQ
jgi:ankyrin repeat protein